MPRIAIVGAGPAGTSLALNMLRLGVIPGDMVLLDKAVFPRPKLCGGALTWRGTELLRDLVGQPPGGARTTSLVFRSQLGSIPIRERGDQWLYDRSLLDDHLVHACIDAGVEVRQRCAIRGIEQADQGWTVRWKGGQETFEWLVGADGARGIVSRSVGLGGGHVGRLVEAVFQPIAQSPDADKLVFDFDPIIDGIPGYAWIFPYPKPGAAGLWKLGVMDGRGVMPGARLRAWTRDFAQRNGFRPVDSKITGWPAHYYSPQTRAHLPGLILTGEAWGVDPLLAEGIAPALEMARYAAGRLVEALGRSSRDIQSYEEGLLLTEAGKNLKFQSRLARLLYGSQSQRWLRVLFGHQYMKKLCLSGTEAYGQLEKHTWKFIRTYAWQMLGSGLPSNRPISSSRKNA